MDEQSTEEKQQQGYVHIVRKGGARLKKTEEGYFLRDDLASMSPSERLSELIREGGMDFHMHSSASDGTDSPPSLLTKVLKSGFKSFALTDHDTLWGVEDIEILLDKFLMMGIKNLPRFIPGIESSVDFEKQEIHILSYFPFGGYSGLNSFIKESRDLRIRRNEEMCDRLSALGFPLKIEALNRSGGQTVGRVHMANLMMAKGFVSSIDEAFDKYLGFGRPAFVPKKQQTAEEIIRLSSRCGGVSVVAHPALYGWITEDDPSHNALKQKLKALKNLGLTGVETVHGETSVRDWEIISSAGRDLGMLRTAGSDYHGSNKTGVGMLDPKADYSRYLLD